MKTHRSQSGTTLALVLFMVFCIGIAVFVGCEMVSALKKIVPPCHEQPVPNPGCSNAIVWTFPDRTGPAWLVEAGETWTVYASSNLTAWRPAGLAYGPSNTVQSALRSMVGTQSCGFWKVLPYSP